MKNYLLNFASANSTLVTGLAPTMVMFARMDTGATLAAPAITEFVTGFGLYTFQYGATTPIAFLCDGATTSLGSFRFIKGSIDPADRSDEYGNTLVAIGNSNISLGTSAIASLTNLGSTLVAVGNTSIALGITNVALGTTSLAFEANLGITLVAIGNTSITLGMSIFAISSSLAAQGTTIVVSVAGIGSTASSFGTNSADPVDVFGYLKRIQENLEGNSSFTKVSGAWSILSRGSSQLLAAKTITNGASLVTKT